MNFISHSIKCSLILRKSRNEFGHSRNLSRDNLLLRPKYSDESTESIRELVIVKQIIVPYSISRVPRPISLVFHVLCTISRNQYPTFFIPYSVIQYPIFYIPRLIFYIPRLIFYIPRAPMFPVFHVTSHIPSIL